MANGPQKADHRGNFIMLPRAVMESVAWRHASMRARSILLVLLFHHNGWNNGTLAISVKQIGKALGNQNHAANGQALAELMQFGFIECTSGADHGQAKARTYRITFVSTGEGKRTEFATHEYQAWRPTSGAKKQFGRAKTKTPMKFGDAVTATPDMKSVAMTAPHMKFHDAITATLEAEIAGVSTDSSGAIIAPYLINQSSPVPRLSPVSGISPSQHDDSTMTPISELRDWVRDAITAIGAAKILAKDAGIPEATLSRFKTGKTLPAKYRHRLQEACGRALPYSQWLAAG
ncbi:MAG: hypothetical protein B7Y89_07650 [Novosphingobium sp. 32-60-15]|uniref:hypothetical protein n=1 Tax=unclassified Novosphingobium TaxID=2644732 RepID=UPI000BCED2D6|nr:MULTISPECIES: hypothetical protein [unclassified Novosphingobium]OYX62753.1 MAG: hypothetical protein B7Y89_07650 [Novosphingobium sp. 32-60-15]